MKQPEALRLADWCETFNHNEMEATAAELRRLSAIEQAAQNLVKAEREACAKVCDVTVLGDEYLTAVINTYADAIRARGNT